MMIQFNQFAIVQYNFYIRKDIAAIVNDAKAYLQKNDLHGSVDEKEIETEIDKVVRQFEEKGGRMPIGKVEEKFDREHIMVVHVYNDTYVLQMITNAKNNTNWEKLRSSCSDSSYGVRMVLLFLCEYEDSICDMQNNLPKTCRDLTQLFDIESSNWCFLDGGYFALMNDTVFLLTSPKGVQDKIDQFALDTFPRMTMHLLKERYQKGQYNKIIALMNGKKEESLSGLTDREIQEWERHCGIIPAIETETNEAIAFVTENEDKIKIIGSKESRELTRKLRNLRLSYARLAKAISDAGRMQDTVLVNIKNYLDLIKQLKVKEDGGFISNTHRIKEITKETLSYELSHHKAIVERTQAVIAALNEYTQELRDLQAQDEVRLQSVQTSLIASIATLIGVGQLFASIPVMMNWDTELKIWFTIFFGVGTFALSHVVFHLRRANTVLEYICSSIAFGIGFIVFYLWISRYSNLASVVQLSLPYSDWRIVSIFILGSILGSGFIWFIDRLVTRWGRSA